MKLRTDFVTNSSSSSFLIRFNDTSDLKAHVYGTAPVGSEPCMKFRNSSAKLVLGLINDLQSAGESRMTCMDDVYDYLEEEHDICGDKPLEEIVGYPHIMEIFTKLRKFVEDKKNGKVMLFKFDRHEDSSKIDYIYDLDTYGLIDIIDSND